MTAPEPHDQVVELEQHRDETQGRLDEVVDADQQIEHLEQQTPVAQRRPGGFLRGILRVTGAVAKIVAQTLVPQHVQRAYSIGRTAFDAVRHRDLKGGVAGALAGAAELAGKGDPTLAAKLQTAGSIIGGTMSDEAATTLTGTAFKRGILEGLVGATASVVGRRGQDAGASSIDPSVAGGGAMVADAGAAAGSSAGPALDQPLPLARDPEEHEEHTDDVLHDDDIVEVRDLQYEQARALRDSLQQERSRLEALLAETTARIAALESEVSLADQTLREEQPAAAHDQPATSDDHYEPPSHATAADAHAAGVAAHELRGHHSVAELHGVYSAAELHGAYTAAELHGVYSAAELHGSYSASEVHGVYSAHELHGVYSAHELHGVYSADELHGVYDPSELAGAYSTTDLRYGGFTAAELAQGGFDTHELANGGYALHELKDAGLPVDDLRASFSLHELGKVFDAHELEGAFSREELVAEGIVHDEPHQPF